ncbi:serine/threonine protein kinase [Krasilnikovia cinnamomea]|uniref:Serine/threonine protein kinase n=1 Tax=Krasilnikovia cinnamomea TaxID=349313 RepID=A0A4Q7ZDA8_9ACTN|nr:serine/threonine-protein kinase [Krasilnikovia cinnamomea]RZU48628.1 serine/threonine protein kinase [Krasilnikovia cinnamomea]
MSAPAAPPVQALHRNDPRRLGRYRLVGRLGSGGMGVVYLGEDPDGGPVAVKLVHAVLSHDPEFRQRFRSEVQRARQVPSFCTAEVLDADLEHQPPYLVVEYVPGPSLGQVVEERGPLTAANLHSVAVGVATALAGIHGAGVIHRDLKPENVLLAPGSPKVIDFGIARAFEATSQLTRTDQMVGTVAYMAPERFSSEPGVPLTAAADVFAWGCVVGYAGTGRTPFRADSPPATAARILTQPPHLDGLAEPLRSLVELSLAKDPAERPTARELLDMLLGEAPVRRPAGPATRTGPRPPQAPARLAGPPPAYPGRATSAAPVRPPGGPVAYARRPRGGRLLAALAMLLVLAGLGTVAAVLRLDSLARDALISDSGRGGDPDGSGGGSNGSGADDGADGSGADDGADGSGAEADGGADGSGADADGGSADADGGSAGGDGGGPGAAPVEPSGEPDLQDSLDSPAQWRETARRADGAGCTVRGVLRATLPGPGTLQCPGPAEQFPGDLAVEVSVTLLNAGGCAAVWYHWDSEAGGQVLRVCQRELSVAADAPGDQQVFGTVPLPRPIPLGADTRIHLVVREGRAELFLAGEFAGALPLPADSPQDGQVVLGASVAAPAARAATSVTFADVAIQSL